MLVVLVVCLPLFVCMPITADTAMYDLQAGTVLDGGVAYRDILEPNLPGVIWLHMLLRLLIGPSSEAIRLVDFAILGAIVLLLTRVLRRCNVGHGAQWLTAVFLVLFHFSLTEWCHCQRDTWMLLPCLGAFVIRVGRFRREGRIQCGRSLVLRGLGEGFLWGIAFWIKPHIAVPALACFVMAAVLDRRPRVIALETLSVLCGAVIVGAGGIVWLWLTDAWPWFCNTLTDWNPRYFAAGRERWSLSRFVLTVQRFHPWLAAHLLAVPVAVSMVWRAIENRGTSRISHHDCDEHRAVRALVSALYIGWLVQAFLLQHLMDYVHAPVVILAIAVIAACSWTLAQPVRRFLLVLASVLVIASSPLARPDKLAVWPECVTSGSTARVRDALSDLNCPNWTEMEKVVRFLEQHRLRDGELTCYNVYTIHLYERLGLQPSTRYAYLSCLLELLPQRRVEILGAIDTCSHRFVVTDLVECGLTIEQAAMPGSSGPDSPAGSRASSAETQISVE